MRIINANKMRLLKSLCYNRSMGEKVRGGFTLVELALSLAFVGVLSMTVVLLIQSVSASYRRGLILNQINTVAMDLVDDIKVSVQNAGSDSVLSKCELYYDAGSSNRSSCMGDNASSFVSFTRYANVTAEGSDLGLMPVFGAFCSGLYTYVWASGYFESSDAYVRTVGVATPSLTTVASVSGKTGRSYSNSSFRLLKVHDSDRSICVNAMKDQNSSNYVKHDEYDNNKIKPQMKVEQSMITSDEDVVELLPKNKAANLVLYDLFVSTPAVNTTRSNLFYSGAFILGTIRGGINIRAIGNSCKAPDNGYSDLEYCAINKFNFAAMAGGE